jgi:hypothetical protein
MNINCEDFSASNFMKTSCHLIVELLYCHIVKIVFLLYISTVIEQI